MRKSLAVSKIPASKQPAKSSAPPQPPKPRLRPTRFFSAPTLRSPRLCVRFCCLECLVCWVARFHAQRHLVLDADPVAFESHDFLWMVSQYADIFESQIDQNLRANSTFVLHHALPRRFALQLSTRMTINLLHHAGFLAHLNPKSPPRVVQVQERATILFRNRFERPCPQLP